VRPRVSVVGINDENAPSVFFFFFLKNYVLLTQLDVKFKPIKPKIKNKK
jgi:hypothetical protein